MKAAASIIFAIVYSLVASEKSLTAGGHILRAGQKTLGAVAYILFAGQKLLGSIVYSLKSGEKSLRKVVLSLGEVAYSLFAGQRTLKEKGSFLSPFRSFYFLILLNSSLLICLYCGLVAPKTDFTYFLTSKATSTKPAIS